MKVLQVTRQFLPSLGGIEIVVDGLSSALRNAGHHVEIVTLQRIFTTNDGAPAHSVVNGISVTRMKHWGPKRYPVAPQVLRYVKKCDVLHIHAVDFFVDFLSRTTFLHKRPIVLSTHGGIFHTNWFLSFKSVYFRTVTRQALKKVAAVLCVSPQDYDLFSSIVAKEKLHLVPNGVAVGSYKNVKKEITPGLIVGIGRVAKNKGIDRLIHALAKLQITHPYSRLIWIGPDQEGRTSKLRQLAADLAISDRVEFAGRVEQNQLRSWLQKAQAFVCGSSYEGYGLSTVEAMSSGTVPVVTKVGIHPQIIEHRKSGFLVDSHPESIAEGLRSVLDLDESSLHAMGENARRASAGCSWESVVKSYIGVYQSVLKQ
jgi:alpha-1,3-mannosyltransferase